MKSCVCGKQALYFCRSCLLSICKEHKITYEKENQSSHIFDKLQKLTLRQISKITESLTSKINKASECEQQIIDKTESLLAEIQRMCMQAIDIIKEKKQKYASLLKLCSTLLFDDQKNEIERESRISHTINIPSIEFKGITMFYTSDFLEELEIVKNIPSMPVQDAKYLLEENYGLYLQGHSGPVTSLAITADNKHIITVSGGHDNTLRIWNLQNKTQEAILEGHYECVNAVAVANDNIHIVSGADDMTVRIWSLQDKVEVAILEGHTDTVDSVAITSDNKYIVSGGRDMVIIIWSLEDKSLLSTLTLSCGFFLCFFCVCPSR